MFSHIMVGANDKDASRQFYDATFAVLGVAPGFDDPKGRVLWMGPGGFFAITMPIDGQPATPANGGTIGLAMASPEQTEAWHAAGVANGGTSVENAPGWRNGGLGRMYLAYLRDPAGNKLCGFHMPQPEAA